MTETEDIPPLEVLLEATDFQKGPKYHPSKWKAHIEKRLAQDAKIKKVPPDQSLFSLLPDESSANPNIVFATLKHIKEYEHTIGGLALWDKQRVNDLWKFNPAGRGGMRNRLALSLWREAQKRTQQTS